MRALLLASEFPPGPGGIGTHAWELARGLASNDWSITVLAPQDYVDDEEASHFGSSQPFDLVRAEAGRLARLRQARRVLRSVDPRIVVASGASAVWSASTFGDTVPRVAIGHGSEFTAGPYWRRALTRRSFASMDAVVCVSDHTERVMLDAGIVPGRRAVIPNGADEARFAPQGSELVERLRQRLGVDGSPLLLTVGHVSPRKGQDIVIRALPRLLETWPDLGYLIAGLPTMELEYSALATRLGVEDRVRFLGSVASEDLPALYSLADLFVLVSRTVGGDFEGYGIVVVEAALCGRASVVSRGSGLEEAIVEGETGVVVAPEQPGSDRGGDPPTARGRRDEAPPRSRSATACRERADLGSAHRRVRRFPARGHRGMKLSLISHTPHWLVGDTIVGLGSTLREIDYLATLFESVDHVAPLHRGTAPADARPYRTNNVRPVRYPTGRRHLARGEARHHRRPLPSTPKRSGAL